MQASIARRKEVALLHRHRSTEVAGLRVLAGRLGMLALVLASVVSNAYAQDVLLDGARARLAQRDAEGAYALLAAAELQRAGDARFDYLLGVAALDAGHVTHAIFALERVVQRSPANTLARAELGRAYLAAGETQAAREALREAQQGELPEGAAEALNRVLGLIDRVAPTAGPQVSGYLEFGLAYDTNVNSATQQGEFAIPGFGGILFQTSPESRQRHDGVAIAAGGVSAEAVLSPNWKALAATNLRSTVNHTVHDMNTVFVDATLALRRTKDSHSQTLALQNGTAWVGSALYRTANGASAQWQSQFDAASQGSVFAQWSRQAYKGEQSERDTDRSLLGLGYAREFGHAGWLAYGSAYIARERALDGEFAHFGHRASGLRLGAERRFSPTVVGFAEWQHETRRFGGMEPFFDTARRDRQDDGAAGLRVQPDAKWQLNAQVRRTRAASNVVLYDYARTIFQITAQRSFP